MILILELVMLPKNNLDYFPRDAVSIIFVEKYKRRVRKVWGKATPKWEYKFSILRKSIPLIQNHLRNSIQKHFKARLILCEIS